MAKVRTRIGFKWVLALCAAGGIGAAAVSQQPVSGPAPVPQVSARKIAGGTTDLPQPTHALEAADLDAWLDGMIPAALRQGGVPGAVVSVVKDGHIILSRGYGYSDMATKAPMDPNRTLMRPGSTSKLFTWTAVMQLVEQGKLDLNADVNRYLDFKIPQTFGKPITLNDLMTHRGGFEEGLKDAIVPDTKSMEPLGVYLKDHIRPTLFAPGDVPAYSNYGTALAGYIVERVSGEKFEDYITRHIFVPLDMRHSTFAQPLPKALSADMSQGYMSADQPAKPFELISFAPAGALSSTASDMANFMIAHLQDGRFGNGAILKPETAQLMHRPSVALPDGFDVMAHGFFRDHRNGRLMLEHGGDTIVFHSDLAILPEENVGIFMSFNSRGTSDAVYGIRTRLLDGFMDRYFPAPEQVDPPAQTTAKAHGQEIAGRYETSRRVESGFMSLFYVLQGQETIAANPNGTISISSAPGKTYREVQPYIWREVGGDRMLKVTQVDGLRTILDSHNPAGVLQPVPLRRNASFNLAIFGLAFLVLIGGALAWLIAEGARRVYHQPAALTGRALQVRRAARIAVVANLAYLIAWFIILKPILGSQVQFYTSGLDPVIRTLQVLGLVPLLGAVAGVWNAVLSVTSARSWIIKIGSLLTAAALLGVLWIAYVGGLLSFTLNY